MIVVTGATGQLGHQVINHLLARVPASQIIAVDLESPKAAELAKLGVEVRFADYNKPETLMAAFAGADRVLLVSSPSGPDAARVAQHQAGIDAAMAAGVELLAYTSVTHAPTNLMGMAPVHRDTEEAIAASGVPAVILRNGWYAENHTNGIGAALQYGALLGSAGNGRMASASRADLAEAAAIILTSEGQAGKVYDLTGDTTWTLDELAAEVAAQSGKPVTYTDLPAEEYRHVLQQAGLPEHIVELIVDADVAIAKGTLDYVTSDLSTVLGRPTTPMSASVAAALQA
ncbi:SDR family oxidoreductase [Arthrobacter sp. ATA002]|uniref:SDR family oxidoreductase n=1 Tax=Arthrobacter sp. ATA002 TaxID=2991715 RepID=UPI0022A7E0BB|nr:SDR family oxidoreductase [Arthrobacter sp. ATA002]WAP51780.1 SDR family oxidoreductase [Arthrobacter sp. ATA002]